jgi:hypothetical protein
MSDVELRVQPRGFESAGFELLAPSRAAQGNFFQRTAGKQ